jgi:hypothetical protein
MSLMDGELTAPSTLGMSVLLILGGCIWAVQEAWELIKDVAGFLF